jgi:hypothetical protein
LGDALRTIYEDLADSKIKIQSFLLRRSSALMAFHSEKDLKEVNAAKGKYKDIPQLIAKLMAESRTAQALFNGVWLHCSRSIFLDEVKKKLVEIEAGDFKDHHVFDTMLKEFSKCLRSDEHSRGKNKWSSATTYPFSKKHICSKTTCFLNKNILTKQRMFLNTDVLDTRLSENQQQANSEVLKQHYLKTHIFHIKRCSTKKPKRIFKKKKKFPTTNVKQMWCTATKVKF